VSIFILTLFVILACAKPFLIEAILLIFSIVFLSIESIFDKILILLPISKIELLSKILLKTFLLSGLKYSIIFSSIRNSISLNLSIVHPLAS